MAAILTNGERLRALFLVRSLAKQDTDLLVGSTWKYPLTFFSRYKHQRFLYDHPKNTHRFIKNLLRLKTNKKEVLIPVNTMETYTIAKFKKNLEKKFRIPVDTFKKIMLVRDKSNLKRLASECNINTPETYTFNSIKKIQKSSDDLSIPVVIKIRNGSGGEGIVFVKNKKELAPAFRAVIKNFKLKPSEYPIIQEYINGQRMGCSVLANQGDIRAIFTYKSIRQYPPISGISSFRESVRDRKLMKVARKFIKSLDWHGLMNMGFIISKKGEPCLLDINPRIWTSINLPIRAGIDFPFLLYKMALEGDVQKVQSYKTGIRSSILAAEILTFPYYLGYKPTELKGFLNFNITFDDFSISDPLPFFAFFYYHSRNIFIHRKTALF